MAVEGVDLFTDSSGTFWTALNPSGVIAARISCVSSSLEAEWPKGVLNVLNGTMPSWLEHFECSRCDLGSSHL